MTECSLYLVTPPALPADFAAVLASVLDAVGVAAVRISLEGANEEAWAAAVALVRPVTVARGVALVLDGPPALAVRLGCDGAHVVDGDVGLARRILGDGLQLGVACGFSRDVAMQAGEDGADYVSFGPFDGAAEAIEPELLTWWSELMEVPVVAEGAESLAACAVLAAAGADFVTVGDLVWSDPAGPVAGARAVSAALVTA